MNNVKKISQGILVGIGSIVPGVSGGMIAAAFNIYGKLIRALDAFTRKPIQAIISIWQYLLGIAVGILVGFIFIQFIFSHIPIPATMIFIGLIIGGIPDIYIYAKEKNFKPRGIIIAVVTAILMLSLLFVQDLIPAPTESNANAVLWIIVGFVLSISIIIPGLSGTMLLLIIGYYTPLLELGNIVITSLVTWDIATFLEHSLSLLWVFLGLAVSIIFLAKLLTTVLEKAPFFFYQVILGIMIVAPINIIYSLNIDLKTENIYIFDFQNHWYMWLIGIILLPLGIYLAVQFTKDNHETQEN